MATYSPYYVAPKEEWFDLIYIRLDGLEGNIEGRVKVGVDYYSLPRALSLKTKDEVRVIDGGKEDPVFIFHSANGHIDVYFGGELKYRLRKSLRQDVQDQLSAISKEKSCPICGKLASQGEFVRGALMCKQHMYVLGGI